jgi:hypothetical protein
MGTNLRIAIAIGVGYLLGRRKKMRTALAFGAAAAAGRFSQDPRAVLHRGGEMLGKAPVLGEVAGLRKPLAAAGTAAGGGAVSKVIDSVGDRIRRRADALRGSGEQEEPEDLAASDEPAERRGAGGREAARSSRGEAEAEDAEVEDDYDEGEDQDEDEDEAEQDEESEAPESRQRSNEPRGDRSEGVVGPRRKPAQGDNDEGARSRARRPDRERSDAGGAPVRRRASRS